jgi:hypothetical protein
MSKIFTFCHYQKNKNQERSKVGWQTNFRVGKVFGGFSFLENSNWNGIDWNLNFDWKKRVPLPQLSPTIM